MERGLIGVIYPILIITVAKQNFTDITITKFMLIILFVVFAGGTVLLTFSNKNKVMNWAIIFCTILFMFSGGLVNPIQR